MRFHLFSLFPAAIPALVMFAQGATPDFTLQTHPGNLGVTLDTSLLRHLEPYDRATADDFVGWAKSGMLIARRTGDWQQLFELRAPGAEAKRISNFTSRVDRFNACPDPARRLLLLTRDAGGDEQYRLSLYRWDTRRETRWPAPPGRVSETLWNDDGTCFAYALNPSGGADWDLHVGVLPDSDRLVLHRPGAWVPLDFSPDRRYLLVLREISAAESELWRLSLAYTVLTRVLPHDPPQAIDQSFFLPDSGADSTLALVSDRGGEFQRLYRYRIGDAEPTPWSPPMDGDVEWVQPRPDRRQAILSVDQDGVSRLFHLQLHAGATLESVDGTPSGVVWPGSYRFTATGAAMEIASPSTPGAVYAIDSAGVATLWAPGQATVNGEASSGTGFWFPTFDSAGGAPRRIPARIWLPPKPWTPPYPVLIQIHGGPELQSRPSYDPFLRFCTRELGLAVIEPNVRGSTGYGKSYERLDDGRLRPDAVRDLGSLLDAIDRRSDLDARRVAVYGRSYGGFMALSVLERYGTRLRAGISAVGISDFPSFLQGTADYRRDLRRVEYGDERDPAMRAFLHDISPLTHADRIQHPLLLIHGRHDSRVPLAQSEKMFAALKNGSAESWFFILEGEGHGVRLHSSETLYQTVMAQFLIRQLGLKAVPGR